MSKKKERRRFGDRFDGTLIKDLDSMHIICPVLYPNRCDNEAYISERIDMAPIRAYVERKNAEEGVKFPYTPFHVIATAIVKVLTLRPKLNRFVANKLMYQRKWVSISFVVKKIFSDDGGEGLAVIYGEPEDTADTIHEKLYKQISVSKSNEGSTDASSDAMDIVAKMPRRMVRAFVEFVSFLDRIGKCPRGFISTDPYYTSCVLSNLGSIKLKSGYHHLTNWGTCSLFGIIGEIKQTASVGANGETVVKETVDLGITVDERLADGYYCSKSIKLLKAILENPDCLDRPMGEEIQY